MRVLALGTLSVICLVIAAPAAAEVIDLSDVRYAMVAGTHSDGLLLWNDSWTWIGAPRSETSYPNEGQLRLQADLACTLI